MGYRGFYEKKSDAIATLEIIIMEFAGNNVYVGITNDVDGSNGRLNEHKKDNKGDVAKAGWIKCASSKMAQEIEYYFIHEYESWYAKITGGTGGNIQNDTVFVYAFPANNE